MTIINLNNNINIIFFIGNGLVSWQEHQPLVMFICIHFIISSLKLKCMDSFKLFFTLGTWHCSALLWALCVVRLIEFEY